MTAKWTNKADIERVLMVKARKEHIMKVKERADDGYTNPKLRDLTPPDKTIEPDGYVISKCPICLQDNCKYLGMRRENLPTNKGWFIFEHGDAQCNRCGAIYSRTHPPHKYVERYYKAGGGASANDYDVGVRIRLIRKYVLNNSSIAEIGPGTGAFVKSATKFGYSMMGVDIGKKLPRDIDCVCAYNVFEHLLSPNIKLQQIYEALKPSGILIIEVPHYGEHQEESMFAEHFCHYTPRLLQLAVTLAGFEVLDTVYPHSRQFCFAVVCKKTDGIRYIKS